HHLGFQHQRAHGCMYWYGWSDCSGHHSHIVHNQYSLITNTLTTHSTEQYRQQHVLHDIRCAIHRKTFSDTG
ncbi:TPA: hypothetical protein ACWSRI_005517, partial [Escherichia coli]|nr:hypothetical protein [Escherichia coli]